MINAFYQPVLNHLELIKVKGKSTTRLVESSVEKHVDCEKFNFDLRLHRVNVKSETSWVEKINQERVPIELFLDLSSRNTSNWIKQFSFYLFISMGRKIKSITLNLFIKQNFTQTEGKWFSRYRRYLNANLSSNLRTEFVLL